MEPMSQVEWAFVCSAGTAETAGLLARLVRLGLVAAALALGAGGCVSLPRSPDRTPSVALADYENTALGRITAPIVPADGRSAFRLLPFASAAYATRIQMTELAEKTLDVQYYYFPGDNSGKFMMRALRNAAEHGVRVRLLVDDLYTSGEDPLLSSLASFSNIEIRLFNPFPNWRGALWSRFLGAATDLGRVNHRMHNKMFIADNAAAVVGGRNMADEYFMRASTNNFVDIDAFVAGPLVRELSSIFDRYWNSEFAYPLASIVPSGLPRAEAQRRFDELTIYTIAPPPDEITPYSLRFSTLPAELAAHQINGAVPAFADALADPLAKAAGANLKSISGTVTDRVFSLISAAQKDVVLISPYFVPGERGLEIMKQAHERGVHLLVITNSLASTDAPVVHGGYIRYRLPMLQAGVEIRELSPTFVQRRQRLGRFGSSFGALHAKLAVVDHRYFFLGSMNFDERSEFENTELGLIVDSPELAEELLGGTDAASSYTLRLAADDRSIEWVEDDDGREVVHLHEPEVSMWLKLEVLLLRPFVPEQDL
jgi:putative cardiolipin synthase